MKKKVTMQTSDLFSYLQQWFSVLLSKIKITVSTVHQNYNLKLVLIHYRIYSKAETLES